MGIATIRVTEKLPPVCMVCGAKATIRRLKTFQRGSRTPMGIAFIGGFSDANDQRIPITLCHRHANYWLLRLTAGLALLTLGVLAAVVGGPVGVIHGSWMLAYVSFAVGIACGIAAFWVALSTIRAKRVDGLSVTLIGLSAQFVEAFNRMKKVEADQMVAFLESQQQPSQQARIVACPHCGNGVESSPALSRKVVSCPYCRGQFQMP